VQRLLVFKFADALLVYLMMFVISKKYKRNQTDNGVK